MILILTEWLLPLPHPLASFFYRVLYQTEKHWKKRNLWRIKIEPKNWKRNKTCHDLNCKYGFYRLWSIPKMFGSETEIIWIPERGKQEVHMWTNILILRLKKAFDDNLWFNYRRVIIDRALICEFRGPRCLQGDYYKCSLIATLSHLNSLWIE